MHGTEEDPGSVRLSYFHLTSKQLLRPTNRLIERKDGKKSYDASPHSVEMTALNKKFSMLHGISSLLNLGSFIGSVVYGVTLAARL